MRRALAWIGLAASLAAYGGEAVAQAKPGSYEALSSANRRIVSAIYEAQLGSRRDMAGHPLLSKDEITAMRRRASWEEIHQRLGARGYIVSQSLADAMRRYERDPASASPFLIISTGDGSQVVVRRYSQPRSARPDPARANLLPATVAARPDVTVVELPVKTAGASGSTAAVDVEGGIVAPAAAAAVAGPTSAPAR